jgi:hypothetical protein
VTVTQRLSEPPTLDELRAEAAQISAPLDAEAARGASLSRRRADNLSLAESARSVLSQAPALWPDIQGPRVDLAAPKPRLNAKCVVHLRSWKPPGAEQRTVA